MITVYSNKRRHHLLAAWWSIFSPLLFAAQEASPSTTFQSLASINRDVDPIASAFLLEIEQYAAKTHLSKEDLLKINHQLRSILPSSSTLDRLDIISAVNSHLFFHCYDLIHQVLCHSKTDLVSLHEFFYFDEDSAYLKPEAILFLNAYFKSQYDDWGNQDIVSLSYTDLKAHLTSLLSHEDSFTYVVLERSTGLSADDIDFHLTPLCIEKKNKHLTLIVTDSKGFSKDTRHIDLLQSILQEMECDYPIDVYLLNECRQSDWFSCSIFSFLDLRNMIEMEHTCFSLADFSKDNSTLLKKLNRTVTLYELNTLPPSMLKVTQSIRQLRDWCRTPSPSFHIVRRLSVDDPSKPIVRLQDAAQMTRAIDYYSVYGFQGEQVNYYLTKKWTNCVYILYKEAIKRLAP